MASTEKPKPKPDSISNPKSKASGDDTRSTLTGESKRKQTSSACTEGRCVKIKKEEVDISEEERRNHEFEKRKKDSGRVMEKSGAEKVRVEKMDRSESRNREFEKVKKVSGCTNDSGRGTEKGRFEKVVKKERDEEVKKVVKMERDEKVKKVFDGGTAEMEKSSVDKRKFENISVKSDSGRLVQKAGEKERKSGMEKGRIEKNSEKMANSSTKQLVESSLVGRNSPAKKKAASVSPKAGSSIWQKIVVAPPCPCYPQGETTKMMFVAFRMLCFDPGPS